MEQQTAAVFEAGGEQHWATVGDLVRLHAIPNNAKEGDPISFDKVLLVDTDSGESTFGLPYVKGAQVSGVIEKTGRDKKISVIRFRAKSNYSRNYGHRQPFCTIRIKEIAVS